MARTQTTLHPAHTTTRFQTSTSRKVYSRTTQTPVRSGIPRCRHTTTRTTQRRQNSPRTTTGKMIFSYPFLRFPFRSLPFSHFPRPIRHIVTRANRGNSTPTAWLDYNGQWGDEQYPDGDSRQLNYLGLNIEYRYASGPNGPKFKQLNRTEVCPANGNLCILRPFLTA